MPMDFPSLEPALVILVSLVILFAAVVKGVVGLGFPLISVPIVAVLIGPRPAVVLIAVPTFLANLFLLFQGGGSRRRLRQLAWLVAGVAAGAAVGARSLRSLDADVLSLMLGMVAGLYALAGLLRLPLRLRNDPRPTLSLGVGAFAGWLGGTTTIYAPVLAGYLDTLGLTRDELVFWLAGLFLVGTLMQVLTFLHQGLYEGGALGFALYLSLPMLAGAWVGVRVRRILAGERFRIAFLVVLLASGVNLIVRAFAG